ncbi:cysteine-rich tail protein 1 [Centrocercus urophasianus]|uniref:cysteine-rich tail protein 1 n=1 Tax=Centrocercus urophasianus TaxID=9002 RepID=UPI001C64569B|nr:cysteine-rich tail protein 1 [Centrocercus urophasianus]XP_042691803.1 cysteine-rich tail protein 1 [Centrocercus urophasianus]
MDRGVTLENPYASVNIPRSQFQQSFIARYLEDEPASSTIIANPTVVPVHSTEEQAGSWDKQPVSTEKSWSRPLNPYASMKMPNGESPNSFYTVTLDKPPKGQGHEDGRRSGCRRCFPCCRKCCCVIS